MSRVVVLGAGYVGARVAARARTRGDEVIATVRSEARAPALRALGVEVRLSPTLDRSIGADVDERTHVVVAFQPDETTEAAVAPAVAHARAITVVSSTAVYGLRQGVVDESTRVEDPPSPRAEKQQRSEAHWRAVASVILRCPAIYGPDRGQHLRILRGEHVIPGDGSRYVSRIQADDLASLILASASLRDETLVVGDLAPATHREVAEFVARTYGVAMPREVPLESVHETLRGDRRVDARFALERLGVTLTYPSYREGMAKA